MMRISTIALATGMSALAAGSVLSPAFAQSTQTAPAEQTAPAAPATPASPSSHRSHAMTESQRTEQRLAWMHKRLGINQSQQAAWNQFAQASIDNANKLDAAFRQRADQIGSMNAVQSMDSFVKIDMQRAQDMQSLEQQFAQLYGALSPEQQQEADQMFRNVAQRAAKHHGHNKS